MKTLRIDIANYFLVVIIINIILDYFLPIKQIINPPLTYVGIILFVIGWIPNIWLGPYFRKIGTSIPSKNIPRKLITSGLFRFSRNPNYLGMIIALFGEAIFLGSIVSFILPILFAFFVKKFNVTFEEKNLEKRFGKEYLEYKNKVRRWI